MNVVRKPTFAMIFQIAWMMLVLNGFIHGQSLESKLMQKATFIPTSQSGLEQLRQIAQHYEIPMGIEWADPSEAGKLARKFRRNATVRGVINTILKRYPGYQAIIKNAVLHISNPKIAASSKNFLNLQIAEFRLENANVFDAEASLGLRIDMTLHPQRYVGGYNGGHGHPADHTFSVRNISFSAHNLSVREILNKIVAANGNALWVVRLNTSRSMNTERAFFAQEYESETFHWQFVPLRDKTNDK